MKRVIDLTYSFVVFQEPVLASSDLNYDAVWARTSYLLQYNALPMNIHYTFYLVRMSVGQATKEIHICHLSLYI